VQVCIVVGGGIIGTMHAYSALKNGLKIIHCESSSAPNAASVRNFGLIWISGRKSGPELDLALRSRELWGEIGRTIPETGFRDHGSLTLALNDAELEVMSRAAAMNDAHARGFELLNAAEVRTREPSLATNIRGALFCRQDAIVEPDKVLGALRDFMSKSSNYHWFPDTEIADFDSIGDECVVRTTDQREFHGHYLVLAPGSAHAGIFEEYFRNEPIRRVRLQMAETDTFPSTLQHSIADGDSLRYYPAFASCGIENLPPQHPIAEKFHMQLLLAQRDNGGLTIGDTHEYQEPVESPILQEPYTYLQEVLSKLFTIVPPIRRTWDGIYSQVTDSKLYFRKEIQSNIHLVSGLGGRGNTLAPAVAEETMKKWGM
jgi:FAD dependent oxidoreductase TIGR03364